MPTFQLDENSGRKFMQECMNAGCSTVVPFPQDWKGKGIKDDEVLKRFMPLENPLVTDDRSIVEDNPGCIPQEFAGIIIIHNAPKVSTMTLADRMKVVAKFKMACPQWNAFPWKNSVVEINFKEVFIWHLENDAKVQDLHIGISDKNWCNSVKATLETNANRKTRE
jgi:hypothetical protein